MKRQKDGRRCCPRDRRWIHLLVGHRMLLLCAGEPAQGDVSTGDRVDKGVALPRAADPHRDRGALLGGRGPECPHPGWVCPGCWHLDPRDQQPVGTEETRVGNGGWAVIRARMDATLRSIP